MDDPVASKVRDYSNDLRISDDIFRIYRSLFTYDKAAPLNIRAEPGDDSNDLWRREKVSSNTAYGEERMSALVHLPKKAVPPYQAVIYCPGLEAFQRTWSFGEGGFGKVIVESGRALVVPIYKGISERGDGRVPDYVGSPASFRDLVVCWSKDLGRTIDCLETRQDIRSDKLAYLGYSFGASLGAVFTALESRLQTNVLVNGGMWRFETLPEIAQVNFALRVAIPTLMINGR